jgi:hypothetical protein
MKAMIATATMATVKQNTRSTDHFNIERVEDQVRPKQVELSQAGPPQRE